MLALAPKLISSTARYTTSADRAILDSDHRHWRHLFGVVVAFVLFYPLSFAVSSLALGLVLGLLFAAAALYAVYVSALTATFDFTRREILVVKTNLLGSKAQTIAFGDVRALLTSGAAGAWGAELLLRDGRHIEVLTRQIEERPIAEALDAIAALTGVSRYPGLGA
jgi:hypothetical protein